MQIHKITDQSTLPTNIAVVRASTIEDGIRGIFESVISSPVNSAIWINAGDLLDEQTRLAAERIAFETDYSFSNVVSTSHQVLEENLKGHFAQKYKDQDLLPFVDFVAAVGEQGSKIFDASLFLDLKQAQVTNTENDNWHIDGGGLNTPRLIMTYLGPSTLLAANEEIDFDDPSGFSRAKNLHIENAFEPPQWSILAISNDTWSSHHPVVHSKPVTSEEGERRGAAIWTFKPQQPGL